MGAKSQLASAKVKASKARSELLSASLRRQLLTDLGEPILEHRFHPTRRWRFDLAYLHLHLAIEIEGGAYVRGAHTRGKHFRSDIEKYAEAACLGWTVLRVMPEHVANGQAAKWARKVAG